MRNIAKKLSEKIGIGTGFFAKSLYMIVTD